MNIAIAESDCNEEPLQSCINSCTNEIGSSCNSSVRSDLDLSSAAVGQCCSISNKKKRKSCFKRFLELTRNKSFRQLIGNDSASRIKADILSAKNGVCLLAKTSGVLYSTSNPQSAKFYPPNISCDEDCLYPYDARSLSVNGGVYNINLSLSSCSGYLLIYSGDFDANAPLSNLLFYGPAQALTETTFHMSLGGEDNYTVVVFPSNFSNNCEYVLTLTK